MNLLNLSTNSLIILVCILYIVYLNYLIANNKNLPNMLRNIFNNVIVKVLFLLLIVYTANIQNKLGGYTISICLSIIFMLTYLAVSESFENMYNLEHMHCNKKDDEIEEMHTSSSKKEEKEEKKENMSNINKNNFEYMNNIDTPVGKAYENKEEVQGCEMTKQYASSDSAFNPESYRPDEESLASGLPDKLPLVGNGNDFKSDPPGPYTTSGTSYNFNMN